MNSNPRLHSWSNTGILINMHTKVSGCQHETFACLSVTCLSVLIFSHRWVNNSMTPQVTWHFGNLFTTIIEYSPFDGILSLSNYCMCLDIGFFQDVQYVVYIFHRRTDAKKYLKSCTLYGTHAQYRIL